MKKRLFLGILALAAVAVSCSKDVVVNEVPQDQPIEFGTYLGRDAQTKGTVTNLNNLKSIGFGVYSYYTTSTKGLDSYFGNSGTATTAENQFKPNFMDNQQVSWDTNWDYTPKKYWPKGNDDYRLSFFAYSPFDNDDNIDKYIEHSYTSTGKYGQPLLTYTIPNEVSNHQDILFAPISQNTEITKDSNLNSDKSTVKFHFFHALSRIGFAVKAAADYTEATITVNSITLTGKIKNNGTMNLYTATANIETGTQGQQGYIEARNNPGWNLTDQNNNISYVLSGLTTTANNSEFTSIGTNYIMIFPQSFDASDLTIAVDYTVTYSQPQSVSINNSVSVQNTNAITFNAGKAYTFNLSIGLDAINFTADVEDWDTTHQNKDININI